jgi:hypothetical protein
MNISIVGRLCSKIGFGIYPFTALLATHKIVLLEIQYILEQSCLHRIFMIFDFNGGHRNGNLMCQTSTGLDVWQAVRRVWYLRPERLR